MAGAPEEAFSLKKPSDDERRSYLKRLIASRQAGVILLRLVIRQCATRTRSGMNSTSPSAPARPSAHWNNESTPLRVWVAGAEGWTIASRLLEAPQGDQPESVEVRRLDFEVKAPPTAEGKTRLAAYALYNTCEQAGGRCLFLRQDLSVELDVAK